MGAVLGSNFGAEKSDGRLSAVTLFGTELASQNGPQNRTPFKNSYKRKRQVLYNSDPANPLAAETNYSKDASVLSFFL